MSLVFVLVDPVPAMGPNNPHNCPGAGVRGGLCHPRSVSDNGAAAGPGNAVFPADGGIADRVTSGAIWLDEPFGWVQAVSLLILVAALTEVFFRGGTGQTRT